MATNVYIDGYNFYYGAVRGTPYKWIDLNKLSQALFPTHTVNRIRYFTSRPKGLPNDPDVGIRHSIYIRALETLPNLRVHWGRFADREAVLPQYPYAYGRYNGDPAKDDPLKVRVKKFEEKRTDVNLASLLLLDCFNHDFDQAVIISNDSDLAEPIRIVTQELKAITIVVNPQRYAKDVHHELRQVASSFMGRINTKILASSQFSPILTDRRGTFSKPPTW